MITAEYVREQLEAVQSGDPSPAKVRDFALLCIARKYLSREVSAVPAAAPAALGAQAVAVDGDSDFLKAVAGKDPAAVWNVLDQHMSTLQQMNPRAYGAILRRIQEI